MYRQEYRQAAAVRGWRPDEAGDRRRGAANKSARETAAVILLTAALAVAVLLAVTIPAHQDTAIPTKQAASSQAQSAPVQQKALPACVTTGLPEGVGRETLTVPVQRLVQGRMLLVDEKHPLPEGYVPADTFGVLNQTDGRVTCRDMSAVLGEDTLAALDAMLAAARSSRFNQLTVFAGTRSPEQQRQQQTDTLAALARDMSLEDALEQARRKVASPGCSEHQTAWAVDLRVCHAWNAQPDGGALRESETGAWLVEHAWEYGFIQRWPEADPAEDEHRPYHFRYVGYAHAALMHAMDMNLEEYLAFLHQHGAVTLYDDKNAPLATAVCAAMGERQASLTVPSGTTIEDVSMDNLGYAVASCLYNRAAN